MRIFSPLFLLGSGLTVGVLGDVVYVTDLKIFTLLAPCAQDAISYVVMRQTADACGEAVTELQSCVCTKNNNFNAISTSISSSVKYECGSTASDDQASAAQVFSAYCNQDSTITFASPTASIVTQYPSDLPAYSNLAPCAQSGVSYALQSMTYDLCPQPASQLAPCVCGKNQNSLRASQSINTYVKSSCSNNEDVTSAQRFLAGYCGMISGTTAFPEPSPPPGDMSYYITALPAYTSLAPCAKSGVDAAFRYHSRSYCPEGPQALASCACIKEGMSSIASSELVESVKYYCSSTASEDVSSAMNVLNFYCSAARKEVVATDVKESITQTYATGAGVGAAPKETGKNGSSGGSDSSGSTSGVPVGAIAGGVGAVIVVAIAGFVIFFLIRKKRRAAAAAPGAHPLLHPPSTPHGPPPPMSVGLSDKPELAGTALLAPPPGSPHPSLGKTHAEVRTETVSPASEYQAAYKPPPPPVPPVPELGHHAPPTPELGGYGVAQQPQQQLSLPPELQGQSGQMQGGNPQYGQPGMSELQGGYARPTELQGGYGRPAEAYSTPVYEVPGQQAYGGGPGYAPPQQGYPQQGYGQQQGYYAQQGQQPPRADMPGWQSGPVPGYQELDGQYHHAR